MALSLHQQLHAAWQKSEKSLPELGRMAGISCSAVSLSRKLRGLQVMSTSECEALSRALGLSVRTAARRKAS
jgi:hypothetical protein